MTDDPASSREAILRALRRPRDVYVSGNDLARDLGISRAAVWKQINALRRDGYAIESVRGRGHRLAAEPDRLTITAIRARIDTALIGRHVEVHAEINSTNDRLRALEATGAVPEGTVVVADMQTRGRGRRDRTWASPAGKGIYMSVLLRPHLAPEDLGRLGLTCCIAVARALAAVTGLATGVKWPNDIWIHGRKVCGILTAADVEPERVRHCIVGIGVNVHFTDDDFPPEVRGKATSLDIAAGRTISRVEVLAAILDELDRYYARFRRGEGAQILEEYRALDVLVGRQVEVTGARGSHRGIAREIDDSGALVVDVAGGRRQTFLAGDVTLAGTDFQTGGGIDRG